MRYTRSAKAICGETSGAKAIILTDFPDDPLA